LQFITGDLILGGFRPAGTPKKGIMSGLTTHVLDTMHGRPAAGVSVRLLRGGDVLAATTTNADGRCDEPLLSEETMKAGAYRLEFGVGAYYRGRGAALAEPAFLEVVAIEFGIADAAAHYHVPLLVSPFGYSTYRGS
jgi:5-hydroxyisourate hydrolase